MSEKDEADDYPGLDGRPSPPPSLWDGIAFYTWHSACWLFYLVVSLLYIPWALAMHVLLGLLLILVLPFFYWRLPRRIMLYTYVVVVMVPGKFFWYNFWRSNRRRGQVWDYEMGKPKPVQVTKRRRLSISSNINPQVHSTLFAKLPPEVRTKIYEHVILGDSNWLNIMGWLQSEPNKSKDIRIRAYRCVINDRDMNKSEDDLMHTIRKLHRNPHLRLSANFNKIGLGLLKSCKKVYLESIEMLYTLPTFSFKDLHRPPYFLQTVLPQRLALIRSIHLIYDQSKMSMKGNHVACPTAQYIHNMGRCAFCNPLHWFNEIKRTMTGLQQIQVFIFLKKDQRIPELGKLWLSRLLDLQIGVNGLREMKIDVSPCLAAEDLGRDLLLDEEEYITKVEKFRDQLEQRLKRGIERHLATKDALERRQGHPGTDGDLMIAPLPKARLSRSNVIEELESG